MNSLALRDRDRESNRARLKTSTFWLHIYVHVYLHTCVHTHMNAEEISPSSFSSSLILSEASHWEYGLLWTFTGFGKVVDFQRMRTSFSTELREEIRCCNAKTLQKTASKEMPWWVYIHSVCKRKSLRTRRKWKLYFANKWILTINAIVAMYGLLSRKWIGVFCLTNLVYLEKTLWVAFY